MQKIDAFTHAEHFPEDYRSRIAASMEAETDKHDIFKRMTGAERVVCTGSMGSLRMLDPSKSYNIFGATEEERADTTHADDRVYAAMSFLFGDDATKAAFFAASEPADTCIECVCYWNERPDLWNTWPYIRLRNPALHRVVVLDAAEICFRNMREREGTDETSTLYFGYDDPPIVNQYIYKRTPVTRRMMANVFEVLWHVFDREHRLMVDLCRAALHARLVRCQDGVSLKCDAHAWALTWKDNDKVRMTISMNYETNAATVRLDDNAFFNVNGFYDVLATDEKTAQEFVTLYLRFAAHEHVNGNIALTSSDQEKNGRAALAVYKRKCGCIRRAIEKRST